MDSIDICVFNTCDRQPPPQSRTCKKEEEREPEKEKEVEEMELEKEDEWEPEKEEKREPEKEKEEEEREPEKIFRQFCAIAFFGFTSSAAAAPIINVAFFTGLAVFFGVCCNECTLHSAR